MSKNKCLFVKNTSREEDELIRKVHPEVTTHIRVGAQGFLLPQKYQEGITWTQEMVWLISNHLDFKKAKSIPLSERYAFPEFSFMFTSDQIDALPQNEKMYKEVHQSTVDYLVTAADPRFIKTHLPLSLLPPETLETSKVVYVARDPRDVAVSFYYLSKLMNKFKPFRGTFKEFWHLLINDLILWSPYFEHTKEAWQMRNHPNLLFLFYEDMSKDLHSVIRQVSRFLGKDYNEEQVQALVDHLNIDNFKKNKAVQLTAMEEHGLLENDEQFIRKEETTHIRVGAQGFLFPQKFQEGLNKLYNMPSRASDIFVVSFPRSGTTWTQEMVWLLSNHLDFKKAKSIPLTERYAFLEFHLFFTSDEIDALRQNEKMSQKCKEIHHSTVDYLVTAADPRFIKTHLPLSVLPPETLETSKVVYVARDPRDVAVSFYYLSKLLTKTKPFRGTFKEFWHLLVNDLIMWSPCFEHTKEAWQMRNHPNLLFLFYEDMSKDLHSVIRQVSRFLGKDYNEEQVQALAEHLNFDNFKKNKAVHMRVIKENGTLDNGEQFIRKGKVGGWQPYFDEEMRQQADSWISRNLLDTDLRFPQY